MNLNNMRRQVTQKQVQFSLFYFKRSSLITVHHLSGTHLSVLRTIWSTVESFEGLVPQPNFFQVTNVCHSGTSKQAVPGTQVLKCCKVLSSFFESRLSHCVTCCFCRLDKPCLICSFERAEDDRKLNFRRCHLWVFRLSLPSGR